MYHYRLLLHWSFIGTLKQNRKMKVANILKQIKEGEITNLSEVKKLLEAEKKVNINKGAKSREKSNKKK